MKHCAVYVQSCNGKIFYVGATTDMYGPRPFQFGKYYTKNSRYQAKLEFKVRLLRVHEDKLYHYEKRLIEWLSKRIGLVNINKVPVKRKTAKYFENIS
jgi:hypothetical protein